MKRIETLLVLGILAVAAIIIYFFSRHGYYAQSIEDYTYSIKTNWELPNELREVSGIAWLPDSLMATVEDERGIIYLYDLRNFKIKDTIHFGGDGDFEAIAIKDNDAYVMRSDGRLFEVLSYRDSVKKQVNQYKTIFSKKHNMESMVYDAKQDKLIIIPKDRDPLGDSKKGIYSFSLKAKAMSTAPDHIININDESFKDFKKQKNLRAFRPADIAIHPKTGEYYVLEGAYPKLMILNSTGELKKVQLLNPDDFQQPEGITFSPDGTLYISNEQHSVDANILHVIINDSIK